MGGYPSGQDQPAFCCGCGSNFPSSFFTGPLSDVGQAGSGIHVACPCLFATSFLVLPGLVLILWLPVAITSIVAWTYAADDGSEIEVRMHASYVPHSGAWILSSQCLFSKKKGIFGHFLGYEEYVSIYLNTNFAIYTQYHSHSALLIANT
jgi:nitrate/nitrite transporter NarK